MTKSQKNTLGEINHCNDLSKKSDAIRDILKSGVNPELSSSIHKYASLHYKKRTQGNLSPEEKQSKLVLKDLIARQVA